MEASLQKKDRSGVKLPAKFMNFTELVRFYDTT